WAWRRSLEVDSFVGVAAPMARAFELVLAGLPVGRAPQVSASGVNHEQPFGVTNHPDAVLLLELGVDPETEIGGISDSKDCTGLEDGARKEEPQKHQKLSDEESADRGPDNASPHSV